ncbi:hypothetical protein RhiirA4_422578 [Rhizophagus irregularis]|uniref:Uncharacterized protein n=1 Tax=Rhizophagus irregularis TaxID=588596 RepID=A0A2I1GQU1_9GLOM|nr:hypothetical protein RhiirA4_422578 [Rhizophagus irregularis]
MATEDAHQIQYISVYRLFRATEGLHEFFVEEPASKWCLESFVSKLVNEEADLDFEQTKELFLANLGQIENQRNVDNPIRLFCTSYIEWLKKWKGKAVLNACREFLHESKRLGTHLRQKRKHNEIAEECVFENAKYVAFNNVISLRLQRETQTPPTQSQQSLTPTTPNERIVEHEEYIESIKIVCASSINASELEKLVGKDLANKIFSYRKLVPSIWTKSLEKYFANALDKTGKEFKLAIQEEIEGEEENSFRLYCEKVLMGLSFEDRKFTIHHIAPLFMLYESTFGTLKFDWVEAHARSAKIMEITTDSGIVLVGLKGIRIGDDREIWQMEVSGSPSTPTFGGTKKSINTDILNLVSVLSSHLDLDVKIAKEIKVFSTQVNAHRLTLYAFSMQEDGIFFTYELASAELPFDFHSRSKYMAVLRLMAIFHDELVQQEAIMNKIDRILIPCEGKCVRDVLNLRDI